MAKLKIACTTAPILAYFNCTKDIPTDQHLKLFICMSSFPKDNHGVLHPEGFVSNKHSPAKENCKIYIVEILQRNRPQVENRPQPQI
jgi:hypothetical protein